MINRSNRNRIEIPNGLAALAALAIVLGCIADPEQISIADSRKALAGEETNSSLDDTVTDLVGVAVAAAKPVTFSISSLIFRF